MGEKLRLEPKHSSEEEEDSGLVLRAGETVINDNGQG